MPYRRPPPSPIEEKFWEAAKDVIPELEREVEIGDYRVDFIIRRKKVIVELYGYKWHNSKKKITQDKERERELIRMGYKVIPFTGSEVWQNPQKCVHEVMALLRTLPNPPSQDDSNESATNIPVRLTYKPQIIQEAWNERKAIEDIRATSGTPITIKKPERQPQLKGWQIITLIIVGLFTVITLLTLTVITFTSFMGQSNDQAQVTNIKSSANPQALPAPENKLKELFPFTGNATTTCAIVGLIILGGLAGGGEKVRRRRRRRRVFYD
jgi:very-short-patch-repair endonuclease